MNAQEKLNNIAAGIKNGKLSSDWVAVYSKEILAIAEAFCALLQRAEAAEAAVDTWRKESAYNLQGKNDAREYIRELEGKLEALDKQQPVAWLVLNSSEGYVERNPDVVAFLEAAGLTKCKPLFARPVRAVSLAPVSNCLSFFASAIKSGESWSEACQRELDAGRETLRNIEGANK